MWCHGADLLQTTLTLYKSLLLVNSWQFAVSVLYLLINYVLSTFLLADEWDGYLTTRKTLRVSAPEGIQRSSYFLSMPFKYSLPLIATMSILYWLISQSIFVTRIIPYLSNGEMAPTTPWISTGYSPIAIIACESLHPTPCLLPKHFKRLIDLPLVIPQLSSLLL